MTRKGERRGSGRGGPVSVCSFNGKDGLGFGVGSWLAVSDDSVDAAIFSSTGKKIEWRGGVETEIFVQDRVLDSKTTATGGD
jgi:hypothetical protein